LVYARNVAPPGLSSIEPFASLDAESLAALAGCLTPQPAVVGERVVVEGDDGECMYFITQGRFRVERESADGSLRIIAEMGAGEFFGEMSLLSGAPRFATVVASSDGELFRLDRKDLADVMARSPAVGAALERFYKERLVANVGRASRLFQLIVDGHRQALERVVRVETHAAGSLLIEQRAPGRGFFLLLRGTCEVFHRGDGGEVPYPALHEGDVFGELSLLQDTAATANVRAQTRVVVLAMGRQWFDEVLLASPAVRSEIYALALERSQRTRELLVKEELEKRLI
jgi:cAMP-dependent protein kinase regulator